MLSMDPDPVEDPDLSFGSRARNALLHDLSSWRDHLARSIARNNYGLQSDTIASAANRIIGRFLFLCIAEDRGLIKAGTLHQIHDAADPLSVVSDLLFPVGNPWEEVAKKDRLLTSLRGPVIIEDRVIQKILVRLCQPDRQYHFGTVSNEILSEVFDQYFTRDIRRSAENQAVVVETRDTLQSQGTPTPSPEMIEYLVHQSVAGVFANRNPEDVSPVRVLDMACGSGRELISAYQHLRSLSGCSKYTLAEQKEFLCASVHGVDLDPHAVAVAKMLLLFELCKDSEARVLPENFLELAGLVFRGLENNILFGNSLVDKDVDHDDSIAFSPAHERHRIDPHDWEHAFPEILRPGGFDLVLGNLPDGTLQSDKWVQRYFQRHYSVYHPKADRSAYFIERGLSLLCPGGMLGCIAGNRWLRAKPGSFLRKHMLSFQFEEIIDFGTEAENKLHPSLCIIRITRLPASHKFFASHLDSRSTEPLELQVKIGKFPIDQTTLGGGGWKFRDTRVQEILEKVRNAGTLLEEVVMGRIHHGIITGYDKAFVIDTRQRKELIEGSPKSKSLIRPFIPAGEIVRYGIPSLARSIIFIPQGWTAALAGNKAGWRWFRKKFPAIALHLKSYEERAKARKHQGDFWWECAVELGTFDQTQSRIIFAVSGNFPAFIFDAGASIPDHHTQFINSSSFYLLAILNSRLVRFVFRVTAQANSEKNQMQAGERIAAIPIYTPDLDDPLDADRHDRMVTLVTGMLELQKHLSQTTSEREKRLITQEIDSTDRQIDSLVYGIYGLTADEIAVVEESILR
jgi:SAM-dependent methyltransferase